MTAAARHTVEVRRPRSGELPAVAAVLAHGLRDDPSHVAVFGDGSRDRQTSLLRLYIALFDLLTQDIICAVEGDTITGVAVMAGPGTCHPTARQRARMASKLGTLRPRRLARMITWQSLMRMHDLERPHVHLGPLTVDADGQDHGTGSRLLRECTRRLDATGQLGYLQTDRPEQLAFYERHGFVVTWFTTVFGVPTWFMKRPPEGTAVRSLDTRSCSGLGTCW